MDPEGAPKTGPDAEAPSIAPTNTSSVCISHRSITNDLRGNKLNTNPIHSPGSYLLMESMGLVLPFKTFISLSPTVVNSAIINYLII